MYQISYRYLKPFMSYRSLKRWKSDTHTHTYIRTPATNYISRNFRLFSVLWHWYLEIFFSRKHSFLGEEAKVSSSEPGGLFYFLILFPKNWWKMGSTFSKKFQTPAIFSKKKKKRLLVHCFDSSKTVITHLFWFKRDVLDNILTSARNLTENGLPPQTP